MAVQNVHFPRFGYTLVNTVMEMISTMMADHACVLPVPDTWKDCLQ